MFSNKPLIHRFLSKGFDNNSPVPMVLDLHGWTGSAQSQTHESGWKQLGNNEKFVVVWPDGMDDSPSKMGSWNCSMTTGKTIQENRKVPINIQKRTGILVPTGILEEFCCICLSDKILTM